ncbi:MAG: GAF domain-containing protein [Dysgonamonadaceae bacterium]|jgi:hypothetical protein|nr:GAF domain-containing protein [Dysgonamonadaceae bacterium]
MRTIILFLGIMMMCCFVGCNRKNSQQISEKTEIESLDSATTHWRYISLDSAFVYSNKALKAIEDTTISSTESGIVYLNHANLYYLCSRLDSAEIYLKKYDNLKINNLDSLYTKYTNKQISEQIFHKYIYLKMLRDIQEIEIKTRKLDFKGVAGLLDNEPLIALHEDWDNTNNSQKYQKKYGNFHKTKEWSRAKMLYSIRFAFFKLSSDVSHTDINSRMKDLLDAQFQLSTVSDTIIDAVKEFDEPILFHYDYVSAKVYFHLAEKISKDATDYIKNHWDDLFVKGDRLQKEKDFLFQYKDSAQQAIAKYYYHKADTIYKKQYDSLIKYTYWTACFKQDLARLRLANDSNFPSDSINVEKYLNESDNLYEKWGGGYPDFFRPCQNKIYLAKYYYSLWEKSEDKKYRKLAEDYALKAKNINENANSHDALAFREKFKYVELLYKIDKKKYEIEWLKVQLQQKEYVDLEKLENAYKNKYEEEYKEKTRWIVFIIMIIAAIIIFFIIKLKDWDKINKLKGLTECYETYIEYWKAPELKNYLAKIVARKFFDIPSDRLTLYLCLKNKEKGKEEEETLEGSFHNIDTKIKEHIRTCFKNEKQHSGYIGEKSYLFNPIKTGREEDANGEEETNGVLVFELTKNRYKFTDQKKEYCQSLAGFIATSMKGEYKELQIVEKSIKEIYDINYKELDYESLQKFYNIVYEFMFGIDANKSNQDCFSTSLWLEEYKNDRDIQKIQDKISKSDAFISPKLKNKDYVDKGGKIFVEYTFERYIKEGVVINLEKGKHRNPTYLHDYSARPAVYWFAKSKADTKEIKPEEIDQKIHVLTLQDWRFGIIESDKNELDRKIKEELEKRKREERIIEYENHISKLEKESEDKKYKDFINKKYIGGLDSDIFYKKSASDGLPSNSMIYYPIVVRGEVIGILGFQHQKPFYFKEQHRHFLKIVAKLIGFSIEKEDALQKTKRDFMENIGKIVTHSTNNINVTLRNIAKNCKEITFNDISYFSSNINLAIQAKPSDEFLENNNYEEETDESVKQEMKQYLEKMKEKCKELNNQTFCEKNIFDCVRDKAYNIPNSLSIAVEDLVEATTLFDYEKINTIATCDISELLENQKKRCENRIKNKYPNSYYKWEKQIHFEKFPDKKIQAKKYILIEIFQNLMINTFEHGFSEENLNENINVEISIKDNNNKEREIYYFQKNSKKIKEENGSINWIFDSGKSAKKEIGGVKGIGLFGVKYLVETHLKGEIKVENFQNENEHKGVKFIIKYKI